MPILIRFPALSTCFKYAQILDYDRHIKLDGIDLKRENISETQSEILEQEITIKEIFALTPNISEASQSCRVKLPQRYEVRQGVNSSECSDLFDIKKFFFVEYICYRYQYIKMPNTFHFDELAYTPKLTGMIFEVTPGEKFKDYRSGKFVIHTENSFPVNAIGTAHSLNRPDRLTNETLSDLTYFLSYFKLEKTRLPPPMSTDCLDYERVFGVQSRGSCRQSCIHNKSVEILDRIPFTSIELTPTDMRSVSYRDIADEHIRFSLFKFYNECSELCHRKDCNERSTFNTINYVRSSNLRIRVMIPREPWFHITYKTIIAKTEYIIYMLSSVGTWFGLSAINLNPISILAKISERWRERNAKIKRPERSLRRHSSRTENLVLIMQNRRFMMRAYDRLLNMEMKYKKRNERPPPYLFN